jgi:hypothetical protein
MTLNILYIFNMKCNILLQLFPDPHFVIKNNQGQD